MKYVLAFRKYLGHSYDNKLYYYKGKDRTNGKVVPVFITEQEYKKGKSIQYFIRESDMEKALEFILANSEWKYVYKIRNT